MMSDFEDGVIAALDGQDECTNPHSLASPAFSDWQDGWLATSDPCRTSKVIIRPVVEAKQENPAYVVIH